MCSVFSVLSVILQTSNYENNTAQIEGRRSLYQSLLAARLLTGRMNHYARSFRRCIMYRYYCVCV